MGAEGRRPGIAARAGEGPLLHAYRKLGVSVSKITLGRLVHRDSRVLNILNHARSSPLGTREAWPH